MKLVQIMFVNPAQTEVVERGFSMHKIIKNRLRNRLHIMTLDPLFLVKMCSMKTLDAAAQKSCLKRRREVLVGLLVMLRFWMTFDCQTE